MRHYNQTKALFRSDAVGLPRGVKIIAASFEDHTAIAYAAMLETPGGGFQAPPMASP